MKYVKPDLYVEEFELNTNVAACNRLPVAGEFEYKATTVTCLATSQDTIFVSGVSDCKHVVNPDNAGSDYMFLNYDDNNNNPGDGLYFIWKSSDGKGGLTDDLREILNKVKKSGTEGKYYWHAGKVSNYLEQLYSHST